MEKSLTCPECGRETKPEDMYGAECADCMNHRQEAEQSQTMMQVTREMAMDAGDRSMEGAWIEW